MSTHDELYDQAREQAWKEWWISWPASFAKDELKLAFCAGWTRGYAYCSPVITHSAGDEQEAIERDRDVEVDAELGAQYSK